MIVQHVLVPIDFSATADRALAYAIALAQQLQARLTLLHVLDMTPLTMDEMTPGVAATYLEDAGDRGTAPPAGESRAGPTCRAPGREPPRSGHPPADDCGHSERAGGRSDYHGDAWADGARPRVFGQCGRTRGPPGTVSRAGGPQSP